MPGPPTRPAPFESTPLDWPMLGDACEKMVYLADPVRTQAYFDMAVKCWQMVLPPERKRDAPAA